jgi:hypothetical protein
MADPTRMSLSTLKARMDSELSMLGFFNDDTKFRIIADSVRQFIRKYEPADLAIIVDTPAPVGVIDTGNGIIND